MCECMESLTGNEHREQYAEILSTNKKIKVDDIQSVSIENCSMIFNRETAGISTGYFFNVMVKLFYVKKEKKIPVQMTYCPICGKKFNKEEI